MLDRNPEYYLKTEEMDYFLKFYPSGASLRSFFHYLQLMKLGFKKRGFFKYDFGTKENLIRYNQKTPPKYNLNIIKNKMFLFYKYNDNLADTDSVNQFLIDYSNLNIKSYYYTNFGHTSLFWARDNSRLKKDIKEIIESP